MLPVPDSPVTLVGRTQKRVPCPGAFAAFWLCAALCLGGLTVQAPRLAAADSTGPWKFMVTGDSRGAYFNPINTNIMTELAAEALRIKPEFILFPGDLVYYGSFTDFTAWRALLAEVYAAGIGVYPIIGNHDAPAPGAFTNVFGAELPDNGPPEARKRTYFLAHRNALVLGLDFFTGPIIINQAWVNSVLSTNTRPHVFAMGHLPAFKLVHLDCLDDYPAVRDAFWTSLKAGGCRAYFCGHDHSYDHSLLDDGKSSLNSQVHQIIVGTAGAPFYPDGIYDGYNGIWTPVRMYHEANHGYVLVEIDGPYATLTWHHRTGPGTYERTQESWSYRADPPIWLNIERLPANPAQLRLWFVARQDAPYLIEGSSDLLTWETIATQSPAAGIVELQVDPAQSPHRFFRAR